MKTIIKGFTNISEKDKTDLIDEINRLKEQFYISCSIENEDLHLTFKDSNAEVALSIFLDRKKKERFVL